jgi:hypothetical protein
MWQLADVEARRGTAAVVLPSCAAVTAFTRHVRAAQKLAQTRSARHTAKRSVRAYAGQVPTRTRVFAAVEHARAHVAVAFHDLCTGAGFLGVTDVIVPLPVHATNGAADVAPYTQVIEVCSVRCASHAIAIHFAA